MSQMLFRTPFEVQKSRSIAVPLFCIDWFKQFFPNVKFNVSKTGYILQACNGMQGDKAAGGNWHIVLDKVLCLIDFAQMPTNHGCCV